MSLDISLNTSEIHVWNDFYGGGKVLRNYNYLKPKSNFFVVEHGINYDRAIWNIDKNSIFKTTVMYSDFRKDVYKEKTKRYVFNIGSLLNYIELKEDYEQKGSIYFLTHSTHEIDINLDLKKTVNVLNSLPCEIKPEYICVYWKDIQRNKHQIFIENGYKVVSAGHIYDDKFLYRLKEILLNFNLLITNEIGSHVFHAYNCGLKIYVPHELVLNFNSNKHVFSDFYLDLSERKYVTESINDDTIINNYFTSIFSKSDYFSEYLQSFFLSFFSPRFKISRFKLTLIHIFSYLIYKLKPKAGIKAHFFDFIYVRLDKFVKKNKILRV